MSSNNQSNNSRRTFLQSLTGVGAAMVAWAVGGGMAVASDLTAAPIRKRISAIALGPKESWMEFDEALGCFVPNFDHPELPDARAFGYWSNSEPKRPMPHWATFNTPPGMTAIGVIWRFYQNDPCFHSGLFVVRLISSNPQNPRSGNCKTQYLNHRVSHTDWVYPGEAIENREPPRRRIEAIALGNPTCN